MPADPGRGQHCRASDSHAATLANDYAIRSKEQVTWVSYRAWWGVYKAFTAAEFFTSSQAEADSEELRWDCQQGRGAEVGCGIDVTCFFGLKSHRPKWGSHPNRASLPNRGRTQSLAPKGITSQRPNSGGQVANECSDRVGCRQSSDGTPCWKLSWGRRR